MDTFATSPVIWAALASALTWALSTWWHRRKLQASRALIARLYMELDRLHGSAAAEGGRKLAIAGQQHGLRKSFPATPTASATPRSRRHRLMQAVRSRYFPLASQSRRAPPALAFLDTVASTHHASGPGDLN